MVKFAGHHPYRCCPGFGLVFTDAPNFQVGDNGTHVVKFERALLQPRTHGDVEFLVVIHDGHPAGTDVFYRQFQRAPAYNWDLSKQRHGDRDVDAEMIAPLDASQVLRIRQAESFPAFEQDGRGPCTAELHLYAINLGFKEHLGRTREPLVELCVVSRINNKPALVRIHVQHGCDDGAVIVVQTHVHQRFLQLQRLQYSGDSQGCGHQKWIVGFAHYSTALTIFSSTSLASPNTIMVLSM